MEDYELTARLLTSNSVQQEVIKGVLPLVEQYDDVYDVANYIAALEKVINHLKVSTGHHWQEGELGVATAHAITDWETTRTTNFEKK